ncbi:hypothetical protein Vadar_019237 [Vaccinium darrowii]|uniref:Uncharacterized protein n=1 Tax=Vaccinium darrowii TaxID=229202 RepID=A0ACB7XBW2_9ERIC|nr:hypothetical protein Vadar_019237 [Vaccinium darrowii]
MQIQELSEEINRDIETISPMGCEDLASEEDQNSEEIPEPMIGMSFGLEGEARDYYARYATTKGFVVITRSSHKRRDGQTTNITYACHRGGKPRTNALNPLKAHPTSKTDCKASINLSLQADGKWRLNSMELKHNHEMCPNKARYLKGNRVLPPSAKWTIELNRLAGIKMNKAADEAMDSEAKSERVVAKLLEAVAENKVWKPPVNRKQPVIEKIIRKIKKSTKNCKASRGNAKSIPVSVDHMDVELQNIHTVEIGEVVTQGSVNYSCSTTAAYGSGAVVVAGEGKDYGGAVVTGEGGDRGVAGESGDRGGSLGNRGSVQQRRRMAVVRWWSPEKEKITVVQWSPVKVAIGVSPVKVGIAGSGWFESPPRNSLTTGQRVIILGEENGLHFLRLNFKWN